MATHSSVALNMLVPNEVLCFAKDKAEATDIISGDQHPALRYRQNGEPAGKSGWSGRSCFERELLAGEALSR